MPGRSGPRRGIVVSDEVVGKTQLPGDGKPPSAQMTVENCE